MNQNPLVSILINNYNYAAFLAEAIDSAIDRTYENIEVIVVDDGSTDNSREIIAGYGNKVIPIIKENGGQASTFNAGFDKSKGDIICFLDADDLFLSNKIEKIVSIFNKYSDINWCFHSFTRVDKNKKIFNAQIKNTGISGVYDLRDDLKRGKLNNKLPLSGLVTSALCYRRAFLQEILPMPECIKITSDDYLKFASFILSPGYCLLDDLSWQRIHDNNAYTLRQDKQELKANITIMAAYLLKQNFPSIAKFANNFFAIGLSIDRRNKLRNEETKKLIKSYFTDLKLAEKIEINLRSFYYQLKK